MISLPPTTQQSLTVLIPTRKTWVLRFWIPRWPLASGPEEPPQEHWSFSFNRPAKPVSYVLPRGLISSLQRERIKDSPSSKRTTKALNTHSTLAACATEANPPSCQQQMSPIKITGIKFKVQTQEGQERQSRRMRSIWKVHASLQGFKDGVLLSGCPGEVLQP